VSLEIEQPGLYTTVQDLGRPGWYHLGIPQGGALDRSSAIIANALVGNAPGAALLECTYLGPTFTVTEPTVLAVTGATVSLLVNGEPAPTWTTVPLAAGDRVSFGHITAGARYHLAFAGGIDVPEDLGSRSTYPIGALGGFQNRALAPGDSVPLGTPPDGAPAPGTQLPEELRPAYPTEVELRVIPGLYDHRLTDAGRETLFGATWRLTPLADRTGMRYEGGTLDWRPRVPPFGAGSDPSNIVDAGYPVGSIQVPNGTQPIILHRDAVSGGGYAVVATVISADLDRVAQCMPGTPTRFVEVDMDAALAARRSAREHLERSLAAVTGG
jgi:biotin-dependent carboxylase-like uncharacterized protein